MPSDTEIKALCASLFAEEFPKTVLQQEILARLTFEECYQFLVGYALSQYEFEKSEKDKVAFVNQIIQSILTKEAWEQRAHAHFPINDILRLQQVDATNGQQYLMLCRDAKKWQAFKENKFTYSEPEQKMIEAMLEHRFDELINTNFPKALSLACYFGNPEAIRFLIKDKKPEMLKPPSTRNISDVLLSALTMAVFCATNFDDPTALKILVDDLNLTSMKEKEHHFPWSVFLNIYFDQTKSVHFTPALTFLLEQGVSLKYNLIERLMRIKSPRTAYLLKKYGNTFNIPQIAAQSLDTNLFVKGGLSSKNLEDVKAFSYYASIQEMQKHLNKPRTSKTPSPLQDALKHQDFEAFKFLLHMGIDLDPSESGNGSEEQKIFFNYAVITRKYHTAKESTIALLKNIKSNFHESSFSHFFQAPSDDIFDPLIQTLQNITQGDDYDAIQQAFKPYLDEKKGEDSSFSKRNEIRKAFDFLCEFTLVQKIKGTHVDARYSLNL